MSNIPETTDDSFATDVLESDVPVLVDFWAPWCGPCRAMGPAIDKLGEEMGDRLRVLKHNTQDHPTRPMELGVMSIPCFLIFKDGQEVGRNLGMMDYGDLQSFAESHL
jgi:thioredoxin 1